MTNREKYNDELMAIWESGHQFGVEKNNTVRKCSTMECKDCLFYAINNCIAQRAKWLKQENIESVKTVKASELPVDTIVLCAKNKKWEKKIRKFGIIFRGKLYAQSKYDGSLIYWDYMWLEDGTVVLPE